MVAERVELSVEQRNLQPAVYKNADGSRRASGRIITSVEYAKSNEQQAIHAKEYAVNLEVELQKMCDGILAQVDESLTLSASTGELRDLCYEMKGDYCRFLVDVSMSQRQAPMNQKVLKTVEVLQVQYIGMVNDVSVVRQGQVPTIRTVQRSVEVPQVQFHDRVADVPVSMQREAPQERPAGANTFLNDCDELIPRWLNAVKGVIDSEDLPLNVFRETLLQNKILCVIKKNLVTKYLEMLAEIAELKDAYRKFYEQLVRCMKLGIHENSVDGVEIAELLRFNTSGDEQINLKEYVDRMKEGQNDICYITGENVAVVSSSSFSEDLRKKGYEVLYMVDPYG